MAKKPTKQDEPEEAEESPPEDGEVVESAEKKRPPLLFIIIGAVALVLLIGGGAATYFLVLKKPDPAHAGKKPEKAEKGKKEEGKEKEKGKEGAGEAGSNEIKITDGPEGVLYCTLPSIVSNIQSSDGRQTYLKLKLTFEVPDRETADSLSPNMPRLRDMFQSFLRELRPEDLQGSQGSYQLRMEFLRRVNLVMAPAKVNSVLIEEMLIN